MTLAPVTMKCRSAHDFEADRNANEMVFLNSRGSKYRQLVRPFTDLGLKPVEERSQFFFGEHVVDDQEPIDKVPLHLRAAQAHRTDRGDRGRALIVDCGC